jgi:O-acetyl-ADP-ribose deacetylase (regulator of RNase III)
VTRADTWLATPCIVGCTTIEVASGSIVDLAVEALVNAANRTLAGGGGVDGAIHAAAGPALKAACLALPELRPGGRCETGEARVTPGFDLRAKYVIHTVGPVWLGGEGNEAALLGRCYESVFAEVERLRISSVALPGISTSAYRYPPDKAAKIAVHEVVRFARTRTSPLRVIFSCLGVGMARHVERALRLTLGVSPPP